MFADDGDDVIKESRSEIRSSADITELTESERDFRLKKTEDRLPMNIVSKAMKSKWVAILQYWYFINWPPRMGDSCSYNERYLSVHLSVCDCMCQTPVSNTKRSDL